MTIKPIQITVLLVALVFLATIGSESSFLKFVNWLALMTAAGTLAHTFGRVFWDRGIGIRASIAVALLVSLVWLRLEPKLPDGKTLNSSNEDARIKDSSTLDKPRPVQRAADAYREYPSLAKDYLLKQAGKQDDEYGIAYRACHETLLEQMLKFKDWELLHVRAAFPTQARKGRAMVVGLVFKTRNDSNWTVWDVTWFIRGGRLIADFQTSDFGEMSAVGWCSYQEQVQFVYSGE